MSPAGRTIERHAGAAPAETATRSSVLLLGHRVDRLRLDETADRCREAVLRKERIHHVSLNAAKVVYARKDRRLAQAIDTADLVSADGQPLVWVSRLLGAPLPERVTGIDLMLRLLELAEAETFRVFFLGARPDVLRRAIENLTARHPRLVVAGSHDGYFRDSESDSICEAVNGAEPDIVFVAMSSPKKEYWVADHAGKLGVPVIVGVGGALDVVAGDIARAPVWMQRAGLEWAFRLLQEPRRLWRRYLTTNARFLMIVAGELVRRTPARLG